MTKPLQQYFKQVMVTDGSWGVLLQGKGLPPGACPDAWNIEKPAVVAGIAEAYLAAGADIILTNTLRANRFALAHWGMQDKVQELTHSGVQLSRQAAGKNALVFASLGPTGKIVMTGDTPTEEISAAFAEQAKAMEQAGADAVLCETFVELDEIALAAKAVREHTKLPVVLSMSFTAGKDGTTSIMGNTPADLAHLGLQVGAAAIGANCGTGPDRFVRLAQMFRAATPMPIWIKPNAGMPQLREGKTVFPLKAAEFAAHVPALIAAGANFIGGCCGTNPDFIKAIRAEVDKAVKSAKTHGRIPPAGN